MRLLLESPAELAGLLSRSTNGFCGGTTALLTACYSSVDEARTAGSGERLRQSLLQLKGGHASEAEEQEVTCLLGT